MNSNKLPSSPSEIPVSDLEAQNGKILSKGNRWPLYLLAGAGLLGAIGYVALPGGGEPSPLATPLVQPGPAPAATGRLAGRPMPAPESDPAAATPARKEAALEARLPAATRPAPAARPRKATPAPAPKVAAEAPADLEPAAAVVPALPAKVLATGKITGENGQALVGATVLLKGSSQITTTDASGNYTLEIPGGGTLSTLVYGFGGYEDETARTRGKQVVNVALTPRARPSRKRREQ